VSDAPRHGPPVRFMASLLPYGEQEAFAIPDLGAAATADCRRKSDHRY
jgi:hypothetical protein